MNMFMGSGLRSLILTSGTLAPLKPLISELELKVDIKLENPHIITSEQVCVKIVPAGPDKEPLNCSYSNRYDNHRGIYKVLLNYFVIKLKFFNQIEKNNANTQ